MYNAALNKNVLRCHLNVRTGKGVDLTNVSCAVHSRLAVSCGAVTENDLEPKTVRERGTSKWPRCADRRCALPGKCDTGTIMSLKYLGVCPYTTSCIRQHSLLAHSKNELIQWRGVRRLSVCKLLRKSLLLAGKWPDHHQTCTRWTPGQRASRVCSRSRSRSKVTWILGMSYSVIDGLVCNALTNWQPGELAVMLSASF